MPLSIDAGTGGVVRGKIKPKHRPYFSTVDSTFILILLSMMSGVLFLALKNTTPNPPIRQRKVAQNLTFVPDLFYFPKAMPTFSFQYFKSSNDEFQTPCASKFASCLQLLFSISEISNFLKEGQPTTGTFFYPFLLALKDIHTARQSSFYNLIDTGAALKVLQNINPILTQDPSFLQPSYLLRFFFPEIERLRRKFLVSKEKIKLYPKAAQQCAGVQFVSLGKAEFASAIKVPMIPISDLYLRNDESEKILCLLHRYQLSKFSLEEANTNYLKEYSDEEIDLLINSSTFPLQELKDLAALYQYGLKSCCVGDGCFDESMFLLEGDIFQLIPPPVDTDADEIDLKIIDDKNADTGIDVNNKHSKEDHSSAKFKSVPSIPGCLKRSSSSIDELSKYNTNPDDYADNQAPISRYYQQEQLHVFFDDFHVDDLDIASHLYNADNSDKLPFKTCSSFGTNIEPSAAAGVSALMLHGKNPLIEDDHSDQGKDISANDVNCKSNCDDNGEHLEDYNGDSDECIENYADDGGKYIKDYYGDSGECIMEDSIDRKDRKDSKGSKGSKIADINEEKSVTRETATSTFDSSISWAQQTSPKKGRLKKKEIEAESVEDCLERFLRPYVDHYSTTKGAYQNILAYSKYYLMTFDDYDTPMLLSAITIKEREDFTRFTKSTIISAHTSALLVDLVGIVIKKDQTTYVTITLLEDGSWNVYKGMNEEQRIMKWAAVNAMITSTYRTSVIETLLYRSSSFE